MGISHGTDLRPPERGIIAKRHCPGLSHYGKRIGTYHLPSIVRRPRRPSQQLLPITRQAKPRWPRSGHNASLECYVTRALTFRRRDDGLHEVRLRRHAPRTQKTTPGVARQVVNSLPMHNDEWAVRWPRRAARTLSSGRQPAHGFRNISHTNDARTGNNPNIFSSASGNPPRGPRRNAEAKQTPTVGCCRGLAYARCGSGRMGNPVESVYNYD
jgi:hypothetical protein